MVARGVPAALATMSALREQREISRAVAALRTYLEVRSPNVMFIAASGNESARPTFVLDAGLPAAELFAVGAVGADGSRWKVAEFSNGRAELVAPGVDVVSAAPGGGWVSMSGTSMATPHVAGVAALWIEKLRAEGNAHIPDAVRSMLRQTASRQALVDADRYATGAGMVQSPPGQP